MSQRTIQVIHNKSIQSIQTLSKLKQLCWLQFKYVLMGQTIKLCTVANFINIHRTTFNWYYVTITPVLRYKSHVSGAVQCINAIITCNYKFLR